MKSTQIDWLQIDAEGADPMILLGLSTAFERLAIPYLEFEVHHKGAWGSRGSISWTLKKVVDYLDYYHYTCYWMNYRGEFRALHDDKGPHNYVPNVWRLTGCYDAAIYSELFERIDIVANVMCVARWNVDVHEILHEIDDAKMY